MSEEPFHCISCGKDYIGERMQCDCATGIGFRRSDRAQIIAEQRRIVKIPFDEYQALKRTQPPLPEAPVDAILYDAAAIDAVQRLLERGKATVDSEGYLRAYPEAPGDVEAITIGSYEADDFGPIGDTARQIASYCEGEARRNVYRAAKAAIRALPLPKAKKEGEAVAVGPCCERDPRHGGHQPWCPSSIYAHPATRPETDQ